MDAQTSEILQLFLSDPVLSKLNQRPTLKGEKNGYMCSPIYPPNYFGSDHICIPQNDADGMSRVNMWNPIVSASPHLRTEIQNQNYKNLMCQIPFRKAGSEIRTSASASWSSSSQQVDLQPARTYSGSRKDYFHPSSNIKLSITKLDNAVSFCQTSVSTNQLAGKRVEKLPKTVKFKNGTATEQEIESADRRLEEFSEISDSKLTTIDSLSEPRSKSAKVHAEQKLPIPLPKVKIFESVPVQHTYVANTEINNNTGTDPEAENAEDAAKPDQELCLPPAVASKPASASKESRPNKTLETGPNGNMIQGVKITVEKRNVLPESSKQMANKGREASKQTQRVARKTVRKPSVASGVNQDFLSPLVTFTPTSVDLTLFCTV